MKRRTYSRKAPAVSHLGELESRLYRSLFDLLNKCTPNQPLDKTIEKQLHFLANTTNESENFRFALSIALANVIVDGLENKPHIIHGICELGAQNETVWPSCLEQAMGLLIEGAAEKDPDFFSNFYNRMQEFPVLRKISRHPPSQRPASHFTQKLAS